MNNAKFTQWFENHKTVVLGVGSTVVLFVFIVLLMDWIVMPLYTHRGAEEELPDVTEMSFKEAEEILKSRGFRIFKEKDVYDATYPESTVVAQNPPPYSRVKKGRRVYVTLSAGERLVSVPHLVGSSERDAGFILRQAGLMQGDVFYEYDNYYPAGVVSNQSLAEGMEVSEKTSVDITISIGPFPSRFVVPDIVGKSLDVAKTVLLKSGLRIGSISYEIKKELIPDTVIDQSIEAGKEVRQGQPVDLVVSRLSEEL